MWPTLHLQRKTTASINVGSRPWTPPDIDSSCLLDPFGPSSPTDADFAKHASTPDASHLEDSGYVGEEEDSIPQYAHYVDAHPHAHPIRTPDPPLHRRPQYPYTPDSAQMPSQNSPIYPIPPLPPMPWDKSDSLSPIQNALCSCISHLESLIQTRQPSDEQMDFLVSRFEEMTQYLSAPEPQSRQSDDHLFSELEASTALVTASQDAKTTTAALDDNTPLEAGTATAYTREVAIYIEDVARYTGYLRKRLDETKQLNSISIDIIADLRSLLREQYWQLDEYKNRVADMEKKTRQQRRHANRLQRMPEQGRGFWASVGYALDMVGEMWLEG